MDSCPAGSTEIDNRCLKRNEACPTNKYFDSGSNTCTTCHTDCA